MPKASPLETLLKRDRAMIVAGLIAVAALAWLYLAVMARGMAMNGMATSSVATSGMAMVATHGPCFVLR